MVKQILRYLKGRALDHVHRFLSYYYSMIGKFLSRHQSFIVTIKALLLKVLAKSLVVTYVLDLVQIAAILTMSLPNVQFCNLREKIRVFNKKDCTVLQSLITCTAE
jgi:hypothetical protein